MGKIWKRIYQGFFWLFLGAVIVTAAFVTYPRYRQVQGLIHERDQVLNRIAEKKREIAALRENKHRFTTDREFVETLARENRRVYPNELVFVFEN